MGKAKITLREHLETIYESTGEEPVEFQRAEIPAITEHIWAWYLTLHTGRVPGAPLAFTEIEAWSRIYRIALTPFEIRAIKAVDVEFLTVQANG